MNRRRRWALSAAHPAHSEAGWHKGLPVTPLLRCRVSPGSLHLLHPTPNTQSSIPRPQTHLLGKREDGREQEEELREHEEVK
ncbi:hypothetical protein E2C01_058156 [Portunus trituberculatus]|uniref:Uncharacterized protein n=1 Tax=Portunus trituberculatus TaxID=210409 RepID=A0A5B7H2F7_PORTR|nr:hypothetical protein [Portunus trituberculatus]